MTKFVAIYGCGPAGLMAAHAATMSGWNFQVFSRKQKSKLFGAQYLHKALPGLDCGMPVSVRYELRGTPEQYRSKVYGDGWDGTVSPEDYVESHLAWDIRYVYDQLWNLYNDKIVNIEIGKYGPESKLWYNAAVLGSYDLAINTMPRKIWAEPGDVFESEKVWAVGDADTERVHLYRPDKFTVVCDGTSDVDWYRCSNIFGFCTMEWPYVDSHSSYMKNATPMPPARGASIVEKPLRHNSTATDGWLHHLGRYGKWEKGVLSTDAFFDAIDLYALA